MYGRNIRTKSRDGTIKVMARQTIPSRHIFAIHIFAIVFRAQGGPTPCNRCVRQRIGALVAAGEEPSH
jgi:hypothetical protein